MRLLITLAVLFALAAQARADTGSKSATVTATANQAYCLTGYDSSGVPVPACAQVNIVGTGSTYPIAVSSNKRYFVGANGAPYLIKADSRWGLICRVSVADADAYFVDRVAHGYNAVMTDLLPSIYSSICAARQTFDGITPFTSGTDFSTPRETFFARVDAILARATARGIMMIFDPMDTGDYQRNGIAAANDLTKDHGLGLYLGNRYKNVPNVMWMSGNDYDAFANAAIDQYVVAVAQGIKDAGDTHIQTVELNASHPSRDGTRWYPDIIQTDQVYTYVPAYTVTYQEYNRAPVMPVMLGESCYQNDGFSCSNNEPRWQNWWTILAGGLGGFQTGDHYWNMPNGWVQSQVDNITANSVHYLSNFFRDIGANWVNLVPDQNHTVGISGFGPQYTGDISVVEVPGNRGYATTARTPDGAMIVSYMNGGGTLTIDMTKMRGSAVAKWFDPTSGAYTTIGTFPNTATHAFAIPGNNAGGDHDWVLWLQG